MGSPGVPWGPGNEDAKVHGAQGPVEGKGKGKGPVEGKGKGKGEVVPITYNGDLDNNGN